MQAMSMHRLLRKRQRIVVLYSCARAYYRQGAGLQRTHPTLRSRGKSSKTLARGNRCSFGRRCMKPNHCLSLPQPRQRQQLSSQCNSVRLRQWLEGHPPRDPWLQQQSAAEGLNQGRRIGSTVSDDIKPAPNTNKNYVPLPARQQTIFVQWGFLCM